MADPDPEYTLFVAPSIDVYQIPPRPATGGHKSGEWRTDALMFTGRLRAVALGGGRGAEVRLEDPNTGDLFAVCPIPPGERDAAVEAAADSSRNFVLRLVDEATGRRAFVGLSFADRGAAFDFNVALTDQAKHERRAAATGGGGGGSGGGASGSGHHLNPDDEAAEAAALAALYGGPVGNGGDLALKAGETIRVTLGSGSPAAVKPAGGGGLLARLGGGGAAGGGVGGVLAPPPTGLAPPPTGLAPPRPPPPPPPADPPANEGWATFE